MGSPAIRNGAPHPAQETAGVQPVPIASPCIRICSINPKTSWCEGCHRTLKEIAGWSRLAPEERDRVMAELPARAAEMAARR